ncbi:hypothetical protein [Streptomyces sp. NPDC018711]|uniref:hypothetical protein n=1 Tax=Streptomyces sp. NPDC018711 TaxID=3365052 RepID=UPI0037A85D9D
MPIVLRLPTTTGLAGGELSDRLAAPVQVELLQKMEVFDGRAGLGVGEQREAGPVG